MSDFDLMDFCRLAQRMKVSRGMAFRTYRRRFPLADREGFNRVWKVVKASVELNARLSDE